MGAHNQKLRTFCGFGQSAHWTISGDKLLDLYVWVLLARLLEVFSQQLALLLLDISPLRLGGRKTSQGSLYLHIHPGVNRNQSGATSLRLTECISSGLLRNLRAIHTDHDRTVLGGVRNVIIFANDDHWARSVGDNRSGDRAHHHARQATHAAGTHDDHGDIMRHFQQHIDRGALSHRMTNLQLWGNLMSDSASLFDLFQRLGLQVIEKFLRRNHALCVQELRHGVARCNSKRNLALHSRICGPADCILGCFRTVNGNDYNVFLGHDVSFPWLYLNCSTD